MIIDVHTHGFPHQGGAAGHKDPQTYLMMQQASIEMCWGRMVTSTLDKRYLPYPGEDVDFRVGNYGRYYWTKRGKECWLQRFPTWMVEMEYPSEHMIAFMDAAGVDKAVLQTGYMEMNYCREYFADSVRKHPGRFIGTVEIDYDIEKTEQYREAELKKLRDSVSRANMRGVCQEYPRQWKIDDDRFEAFWVELSHLKIPLIFSIGRHSRQVYLDCLDRIERVLKKFPDVNWVIGHLGGSVTPPGDPDHIDAPKELFKILRLPNTYFEVGYVLAYENWSFWKENYDYPYPLHTKFIKEVYDEVGAERLLFGSDMPNTYRTCTYQQCLDLIRIHFDFLSEEEKRLVLGKNAAHLFRL